MNQGDAVEQGDLLIEFNMEGIEEAGFELTTPVVITNQEEYVKVDPSRNQFISSGDELLDLKA